MGCPHVHVRDAADIHRDHNVGNTEAVYILIWPYPLTKVVLNSKRTPFGLTINNINPGQDKWIPPNALSLAGDARPTPFRSLA